MKLSLKRKLGFVHVKASRLLMVAHDHQVTTGTENALDPADRRADDGTKWVTARIGDLAIEMVAVQTGNVIGYSYIAGDAIRLNLYRAAAPAHWFTDAKAVRWDMTWLEQDLERSRRGQPHQVGVEDLIAGAMKLKYCGADVVVLNLTCDAEDGKNAAGVLQGAFSYVADGSADNDAHLLGLIEEKKTETIVAIHSQPARHSSNQCANAFQVALLCGMEMPAIDPWSGAA